MATAQEIMLLMEAAQPKMDQIKLMLDERYGDLIKYGICVSMGREVCARRARKLRKAGRDVVYSRKTATGKPRFKWMKRIAPLSIYF
jgi:hypothetical protein